MFESQKLVTYVFIGHMFEYYKSYYVAGHESPPCYINLQLRTCMIITTNTKKRCAHLLLMVQKHHFVNFSNVQVSDVGMVGIETNGSFAGTGSREQTLKKPCFCHLYPPDSGLARPKL